MTQLINQLSFFSLRSKSLASPAAAVITIELVLELPQLWSPLTHILREGKSPAPLVCQRIMELQNPRLV